MVAKRKIRTEEIKKMTTDYGIHTGTGKAEALEFVAKQERLKLQVVNLGDMGSIPIALTSTNAEVKDLSDIIRRNAEKPDRKRLNLKFYDVDSFIEYVNQQKTQDTRIFARYQGQDIIGFTAIMDFQGAKPEATSWHTHKAVLTLTPTPEWMAWHGNDKKQFAQVTFAEFLEEHMQDVTRPTAADLMEVVQNLTLKNDVAFRSQVNLDNGDVQFLYENTSTPGGPKGTIEFPTRFELNIPVLEGSEPTPLQARFRYRRVDAALSFSYYLIQAEKLYRSVVEVMLDKIQKATKTTVFQGFVE
jgi:uncharacterized protein YfdQ (DUF2303 family)